MKNKKFVASAVSAALVASVVAPVVADAATGKLAAGSVSKAKAAKITITDVKPEKDGNVKVYYKRSGASSSVSKTVKADYIRHLGTYALFTLNNVQYKWEFSAKTQLTAAKSFGKHIALADQEATAGNAATAKQYLENAQSHYNTIVKNSELYSPGTITNYKERLDEVAAKVDSLAGKVTAINATTVEVSFDEAISDVKALDFTIEGLTITNAAIKQTDAKTIVLTTSAQEGGKVYTVKESDTVIGTFTGISSVIPTAIVLDTKSTQGVVGKEVTVKATVTVPDGQSKAGIPVTFNIDASNNNLNKDLVAEALTDDNGVATYTYSQYAAYEDVIVAYPTGNASLRETGKVYWGVKPILTVASSTTGDAANGTVKTYTATYVNELTGNPISGATIYVNFQENMDTPVTNDTNAVATDVTSGISVTPYQTATTEKFLTLKTNAKGEATFTVSGSNTTATPVVWVDGKGSATTADKRFEATELQTVAEAAKFVGAQYTFKFNKTETFDVPVNGNTVVDNTTAPNKYFEYEVEVLKADGTAYAGGTAVVDIYENIDDSLSTSSNAKIYGEDKVVKLASGAYKLSLDKDGKAKFKVYSNTANTIGTPVVWVDINDATNQTGKLEKEESNAKAGSAVFRDEVLSGAKLTDSTISSSKGAGAYALNNQIGGELYQPVYNIRLKDQAGNNLVSTNNNVIANATYVLTNTGSSEMTVRLDSSRFTIEKVTNGTAVNTNPVQTIAAGQSITVYGKALYADVTTGTLTDYTQGHSVDLKVATTTPGQLKVSGSVVTKVYGTTTTSTQGTPIYDSSGNIIGYVGGSTGAASNYFAAGDVTTQWVDAPEITYTQGYTGKVVGYITKKGANAQSGHVIIQLDGSTNQYRTIDYAANVQQLLVGESLSNLSVATEKQFETAISVGDTIAYNTPAVNSVGTLNTQQKLGLVNTDKSSDEKQFEGDNTQNNVTTSYQTLISNALANAAAGSTVNLNLTGAGAQHLNITTTKNVHVVLTGIDNTTTLTVDATNADLTVETGVTVNTLNVKDIKRGTLTNKGTITTLNISDANGYSIVNNLSATIDTLNITAWSANDSITNNGTITTLNDSTNQAVITGNQPGSGTGVTGTLALSAATVSNATLPVNFITVTDADLNVDATKAETVDVTVGSVTVTLTETGVNTGVFQNTETVDINSLQNGTITVTYADQKNASGVAQNITQTFTKTQLGENELAGTITPVFGAQRIVITLPTGTTAVDSITVNDVAITDTTNVTNDQLIIADQAPLIQTTDVVKVTIGGTVYTVKF